MKENQVRHSQNLAILNGFFYKGIFYREGLPQKPKDKPFPKIGEIKFNGKPRN